MVAGSQLEEDVRGTDASCTSRVAQTPPDKGNQNHLHPHQNHLKHNRQNHLHQNNLKYNHHQNHLKYNHYQII